MKSGSLAGDPQISPWPILRKVYRLEQLSVRWIWYSCNGWGWWGFRWKYLSWALHSAGVKSTGIKNYDGCHNIALYDVQPRVLLHGKVARIGSREVAFFYL